MFVWYNHVNIHLPDCFVFTWIKEVHSLWKMSPLLHIEKTHKWPAKAGDLGGLHSPTFSQRR